MDEQRRRGEAGGEPPEDADDLIGTPPPGTVAGDQHAGAETGAQPADPDEAED